MAFSFCGDDVQQKYAFMVAGTQSGCGKTTIALGLMAACKHRGLSVQPFKIGPDFIDPGFHTRITGRTSRNLDGWMMSRTYNEGLFQRLLEAADVGIVEGVMGLYDGYDGLSEDGSSAQMAKWLGIPVVLVVDARSMARSAAALVHGFRHFDPEVGSGGSDIQPDWKRRTFGIPAPGHGLLAPGHSCPGRNSAPR